MTACHCARASLPVTSTVFYFDQQPVAQNAGVCDRAVEPAEVSDDSVEQGDDVALCGDVREISLDAHAGRAARGGHACQAAVVAVDERELEPRAASARAIAAPSPRPAPVITIVLPVSCMALPRHCVCARCYRPLRLRAKSRALSLEQGMLAGSPRQS